MNSYELILIAKDDVVGKSFEAMVKEFDGEVKAQEKWEKRRLTYPIKNETSAFYFFSKISMPADKIKFLKDKLRTNDQILRFLLLLND